AQRRVERLERDGARQRLLRGGQVAARDLDARRHAELGRAGVGRVEQRRRLLGLAGALQRRPVTVSDLRVVSRPGARRAQPVHRLGAVARLKLERAELGERGGILVGDRERGGERAARRLYLAERALHAPRRDQQGRRRRIRAGGLAVGGQRLGRTSQ